jgi:tripartite-type tricarboxylate transporter receptor subunit TctC
MKAARPACKDTPHDIVTRLNAAVMSALSDPGICKKFTEQSYEIIPPEEQTPEYLAKFHRPRSKSGFRSSRRRAGEWGELRR